MYERAVEQYLLRQVKLRGGLAFKFIAIGFRGVPDRICFLPGGRLLLVELKRPLGGRVSTQQQRMHKIFAKLGFTVYIAATIEQVNELLE